MLARNPVHSALMLVMTLFGVAVLFVELNAQFLAAVQVIVYAGAIVVLFLFVIMLLGVDRREAMAADPLRGQRTIAVVLGVLGIAEVIALARGGWPVGEPTASQQPVNGISQSNVYVLGKSVFTTYLLAFEVTSALLVIAVIGAVVLARRPRGGERGLPDVAGEDEPAGAAGEAIEAIEEIEAVRAVGAVGAVGAEHEPAGAAGGAGERAGDGR